MQKLLTRAIDLYRTSVIIKTLINMSIRVALVVLVSTAVSYLHVLHNLEVQTVQQLERYITERGQRESLIFELAEDSLISLRDQFLQEVEQPSKQSVSRQFDQQFFRWDDGTTRNSANQQSILDFDTTRKATSFINKGTEVTSSLKRQLLTAQRLITNHGIAWSNRFINTYLNTLSNTTTIYWKNTPLALQAKADFQPSQDEYFYVADPQHNPTRQVAWTGVYADTVTDIWMVSGVVPLYIGEQFVGGFGHDIELNSLIEKTINNKLPGAYNIVFNLDGRLIAHSKYAADIQQAGGLLNVYDLSDPHLQTIFELSLAKSHGVIETSDNQEFLALTELEGPNWLFVTVYPKSLLSEPVWDSIKFVLIAGLLALLIEVVLLSVVLKSQFAYPLNCLRDASQKLADGDFDVSIDLNRQDELGQLALAFTMMTQQLQSAFQALQQKVVEKEQAEALVVEKNYALERVLDELQRAHLQTIQNEKMATLGNLVAGVAHEINNPVGFLNGSIKNMEDYIQDLFNHLKLYQEQQPPNKTVQANAEEMDLDFMLEDFPKLLNSMLEATGRVRDISTSLRTFSRADIKHKVSTNLHEGLDSTLLILKYRLKANEYRPAINVVRDYGNLPEVECFPSQLNQVFMNILANAIDMFDEAAQRTTFEALEDNPQRITIWTTVSATQNAVELCISDNGEGMSEEVKARIFDNLFTTKSADKGTGLGMAIAHQIITEVHGGEVAVETAVGQGSAFLLSLPIGAKALCITD